MPKYLDPSEMPSAIKNNVRDFVSIDGFHYKKVLKNCHSCRKKFESISKHNILCPDCKRWGQELEGYGV